jgi:hypothetical protein
VVISGSGYGLRRVVVTTNEFAAAINCGADECLLNTALLGKFGQRGGYERDETTCTE